jgi:hypothetical protein
MFRRVVAVAPRAPDGACPALLHMPSHTQAADGVHGMGVRVGAQRAVLAPAALPQEHGGPCHLVKQQTQSEWNYTMGLHCSTSTAR